METYPECKPRAFNRSIKGMFIWKCLKGEEKCSNWRPACLRSVFKKSVTEHTANKAELFMHKDIKPFPTIHTRQQFPAFKKGRHNPIIINIQNAKEAHVHKLLGENSLYWPATMLLDGRRGKTHLKQLLGPLLTMQPNLCFSYSILTYSKPAGLAVWKNTLLFWLACCWAPEINQLTTHTEKYHSWCKREKMHIQLVGGADRWVKKQGKKRASYRHTSDVVHLQTECRLLPIIPMAWETGGTTSMNRKTQSHFANLRITSQFTKNLMVGYLIPPPTESTYSEVSNCFTLFLVCFHFLNVTFL